MIIEGDSPLRRLPTNLSPKQAQFCDGVRFSAEMADYAHEQLTSHLLPLSGESGNVPLFAVPPFLFAWAIIDSAHRFRGLVQNFPNLAKKNQSPEFRTFLEKASAVENLRNAVQHMDSDIQKSAEAGRTVWGTLTWVSPKPTGTVYSCLLMPGAMMPGGQYTPINPAGLQMRAPLDHITLTLGGVLVNLSELVESLTRLVKAIEKGLTEAFKTFADRAGSDMWIALAFQPGPNNTMVLPPQGSEQRTIMG